MTQPDVFWDKLHKSLKTYLKPTKSKKFRRNISFSLHGKYDQITPIGPKQKPIETFLSELLYDYGELSDSLKRFTIISALIRRYPKQPDWEKIGLSKTVHLRYHYEAFLNELYLYSERMKMLLTNLKKKCKKKSLDEEAIIIQTVLSDFLDALQNAIYIRGRHVHVRRFKNNKIEQLSDLEIFSGMSPYYDQLKDEQYKRLRKDLSKEIENFASDLAKLQNNTLEKIIPITFSKLKKKYGENIPTAR
ncbi:MAG TPA: hypothetical protein DIT07_12510 [Sphingobacteriaceae bacterium]|nr:hypothetical protein [Sphingobacteriaceae bacterium]